VEDSFIVGEK